MKGSGGGHAASTGSGEGLNLSNNSDGTSKTFNPCFCLGIFTEAELKDIEETKDHLDKEIMLAVLELDEAMVVAMISWAFPF